MTIALDAGRRFGRLAVVRRSGSIGSYAAWECLCDCGAATRVTSNQLVRGKTKSCGCLRKDGTPPPPQVTHNQSRTPLYSVWRSMLCRCELTTNAKYKFYGGRGIIVCERWHDFASFAADMGPRPPGLTIDRKDPNGNYEPGNCRWATRKQQARNRRNTRLSQEIADEIRRLHSEGVPQHELSRRFAVDDGSVSAIIRGVSWIPDEPRPT